MAGVTRDGGSADDLFGERCRLVGLRQYAKSRQARGLPGGWLRAVQDAIAAGRIHTHEVDGRPFLDPEEADAEWDANTAPRMGKGEGGDTYSSTRGELAQVELETKRLNLARLRGELVDAAKVRREAFETGRAVREALATLPARLAGLVMASAAGGSQRAIEKLLEDEIHAALMALTGGERDA